MKKTVVCIVLSLLCISCTKKYCWHCNTATVYYNRNAANPDSEIVKTVTTLDTVCNTSEDDIRNFEALHSDSVINGNSVDVSTTRCTN